MEIKGENHLHLYKLWSSEIDDWAEKQLKNFLYKHIVTRLNITV